MFINEVQSNKYYVVHFFDDGHFPIVTEYDSKKAADEYCAKLRKDNHDTRGDNDLPYVTVVSGKEVLTSIPLYAYSDPSNNIAAYAAVKSTMMYLKAQASHDDDGLEINYNSDILEAASYLKHKMEGMPVCDWHGVDDLIHFFNTQNKHTSLCVAYDQARDELKPTLHSSPDAYNGVQSAAALIYDTSAEISAEFRDSNDPIRMSNTEKPLWERILQAVDMKKAIEEITNLGELPPEFADSLRERAKEGPVCEDLRSDPFYLVTTSAGHEEEEEESAFDDEEEW